jgi:2-dehydro-3-deoxyphosphooctonate aldolase (KDO 8-P synthase)
MPVLPQITIGSVIMDGSQPVFILGPCVIESEPLIRDIAARLKVTAQLLEPAEL